jgi:hypothetical protein
VRRDPAGAPLAVRRFRVPSSTGGHENSVRHDEVDRIVMRAEMARKALRVCT